MSNKQIAQLPRGGRGGPGGGGDLVDSIDRKDEDDGEEAEHEGRVIGCRRELQPHAVVAEGGGAGGHYAAQNGGRLHTVLVRKCKKVRLPAG